MSASGKEPEVPTVQFHSRGGNFIDKPAKPVKVLLFHLSEKGESEVVIFL